MKRFTVEQRFWRHINRKSLNECWNWTGCCNKDGYGRIYITKGKTNKIHRISWEIHFGKIPNEMCVCHTCDNPQCGNPNHLFLGTRQDNSDDMVLKDRQSKGEDKWCCKLTHDKVKKIRELKGKFTQKEIGKMFNVNYRTISGIHLNKTWKS